MRSGVEEGGGWNERRVANSARFRRGLMDCQPGCDQSDRRCWIAHHGAAQRCTHWISSGGSLHSLENWAHVTGMEFFHKSCRKRKRKNSHTLRCFPVLGQCRLKTLTKFYQLPENPIHDTIPPQAERMKFSFHNMLTFFYILFTWYRDDTTVFCSLFFLLSVCWPLFHRKC